MSLEAISHWNFFHAGGFDQVVLRNADDLMRLKELDQKLWATLTCPVKGLNIDERMLKYLDVGQDGRIRAPEILAAIDWVLERLANPSQLFEVTPLTVTDFSATEVGQYLALAAQRVLEIHGKANGDSLTCQDTSDFSKLFPATEANGDGLVPAEFADTDAQRQTITDIIKTLGAEADRSGAEAVGAEKINAFYEQVAAVQTWQQSVSAEQQQPFVQDNDTAIITLQALRGKIDDYFTRVAMAAYDPRAASIMNGNEAELERLAGLDLAQRNEIAALPLAQVAASATLPLQQGMNPAWQELLANFSRYVVTPILGEQTHLDAKQWQIILEHCQGYLEWIAKRPALAILNVLSLARINEIAAQNLQAELLALVEQDKAVEQAAAGLVDLDKLLRFKENLVTLLRNFVSFQNFYLRHEKAVFQAGTLFIDGKSLDLVVEVADVAAHSAVAANSNSFLIYCECKRPGQPINGREKLNIVAAVTAGTNQSLTVGRNGLFYDRDGHDWDATVVKVIENAISVREAFWSPYQRIAGLISNQIQKFAASQDSALMNNAMTKVETVGATTATDSAKPPFDIARFAGIFAAIGLAVGAVGTALAAMMSGLMSLTWWQWPLTIFGLMLVVSGPSMLLAWFKLRRRSLGPILDANGWAVNTQAKISIAFGASLTQLAVLPKGSRRTLNDPYAEHRYGWLWGLLVLVIIVSGAGYYWWQLAG